MKWGSPVSFKTHPSKPCIGPLAHPESMPLASSISVAAMTKLTRIMPHRSIFRWSTRIMRKRSDWYQRQIRTVKMLVNRSRANLVKDLDVQPFLKIQAWEAHKRIVLAERLLE